MAILNILYLVVIFYLFYRLNKMIDDKEKLLEEQADLIRQLGEAYLRCARAKEHLSRVKNGVSKENENE